MKSYLLIAEKPSLMRDIQSCYRKHETEVQKKVGRIDFIALAGHVCGQSPPDDYEEWNGKKWEEVDYPMIPQKWKIRAIPDDRKKKILRDIRSREGDYDGMIVATDSDTEGYGIYYLLETYLGLQGKPALRFIEHSLTDKEILVSLLSMTDIHEDPAHVRFTKSFLVRSQADWLFGMNASRIMSVRTGRTMKVGRVKAPTIKLIYDNSMAIDGFKKEKYYVLRAVYPEGFEAILDDENGQTAKFKDRTRIAKYPLEGTVEKRETTRETTHAPKLFDLTSAQVEAGRLYGFSPEHTLEIIQNLYEKYKVISYPRTQCRCVSSEKAKEFPVMVSHMSVFPELKEAASRITQKNFAEIMKDRQVVNNTEVQKESHDALLPTSVKPDLSIMTKEEQDICRMIYLRLLLQFLPKAVDDRTRLVIRHGDGLFSASGKTVVEEGWRSMYRGTKDVLLPDLKEGDAVRASSIAPVEKTTTPPKRLTQTTLLNAMQNIASLVEDKELRKSLADSKGIGTSATRASIISEILSSGYAENKKGGIYITPLGKAYVESLKNIDLISPEFAAVMDTEIKRVQRGEAEYEEVYENVVERLKAMCEKMETMQVDSSKVPGSGNVPMKEKCPVCDSDLVSGKYAYSCSSGDCDFRIPKNIAGKEITEPVLKTILSGKPTAAFSFKKKDGTGFRARLILKDGKAEFDFSSGIYCPVCGKEMRVNRGGAFCDCGFKVFRKEYGAELTDAQLKKLISSGETGEIHHFISRKTQKEYTAILFLDENGDVKMKFPDTEKTESGLKCPVCGQEVKVNRGGAFCDCGFKLFRKEYGTELTDAQMKNLLTKGKTGKMRFVSQKTQKEYEASLVLDENGEVKISFPRGK